jgi:hypothetical protein
MSQVDLMNKIKDIKNKENTHYAYSLSPIKGDTFPIVAHDGLIFYNFEMFWQANKAYEHLGHCVRTTKDEGMTVHKRRRRRRKMDFNR